MCSRNIVVNAARDPIKYFCKYFTANDNDTLEKAEEMLNNYEAVETGRMMLYNKRQDVLDTVRDAIPKAIMKYSKKLEYKSSNKIA